MAQTNKELPASFFAIWDAFAKSYNLFPRFALKASENAF